MSERHTARMALGRRGEEPLPTLPRRRRPGRPAGMTPAGGRPQRPTERVLGGVARLDPCGLLPRARPPARYRCRSATALAPSCPLWPRPPAARARSRSRTPQAASTPANARPTSAPNARNAEPAVPAPRFLARARDRALRVVPALPAEHGAGEHVVEDLPAPRLVRAQDAMVCERLDDGPDVGLGAPANSARSDASCAIFIPDGVTRWSKRRAAISRCSGVSASIARSR